MKSYCDHKTTERVRRAASYLEGYTDPEERRYSIAGSRKAIADGEGIKISEVDEILYTQKGVKERVRSAFSNSLGLTDQLGKKYSVTGIKTAIAHGEMLKLSEVDRILYGTQIDVGEGYKPYKQLVLNWYNNSLNIDGKTKKLSVKEIAKRLGEFTGKKEGTSQVYKILYSLENQDCRIEWRGRGSNKKKPNSPPEDLERKIRVRRDKMPQKSSWWSRAAVAAGVVIGIGSLFSGITKKYSGSKAYASDDLTPKVPVVREEARQELPYEIPRLVVESQKPSQKPEPRSYMNTSLMSNVAVSDNLLLQEVRPQKADLMEGIRRGSEDFWETILPNETAMPKDTWTLPENEIQEVYDSTSNRGLLGVEFLPERTSLISLEDRFIN